MIHLKQWIQDNPVHGSIRLVKTLYDQLKGSQLQRPTLKSVIAQMNLSYVETPADGSCGVWALLTTMDIDKTYSAAEMMDLRSQAATIALKEGHSDAEKLKERSFFISVYEMKFFSSALKIPILVLCQLQNDIHGMLLKDGGYDLVFSTAKSCPGVFEEVVGRTGGDKVMEALQAIYGNFIVLVLVSNHYYGTAKQ